MGFIAYIYFHSKTPCYYTLLHVYKKKNCVTLSYELEFVAEILDDSVTELLEVTYVVPDNFPDSVSSTFQ
jgi:hypothetical protein